MADLSKTNRTFLNRLYGIDPKAKPKLATHPDYFRNDYAETIKAIPEANRIRMMLSFLKELRGLPNTEATAGTRFSLAAALDRVFESLSEKGREAFEAKYKKLTAKVPLSKKKDKGLSRYGDRFINDSTMLHLISDNGNALWARVGPVFRGDKATETGLWLHFQERFQASSLQGEMLISKKSWERLKGAIDAHFGSSK